MTQAMIIQLLVVGVVLVIASLLLRVISGGKYEIKTIDLVFLVIPLLLVALATGKLKGLDMFGVKADLSALWAEAAETKIENQVTPGISTSVEDVVQVMEMGMKAGPLELKRLIERKAEALVFRLGHGGYYGPAIQTYFEALSGSSHLRTVVINYSNGQLFGIYHASDLLGYLRITREEGYKQFQQLLNAGDERARQALAKLPGFVPVEQAVTPTTSKRDALVLMETINSESLPVVNDQKHFIGTVNRSKLTAGLILAVTDKLEGEYAANP
jgi:CBS domain-containing protein